MVGCGLLCVACARAGGRSRLTECWVASHLFPIFTSTISPKCLQIMVWQAVIFGPDDTPWEGGTFKLLLEFTEDYPNKVRRQSVEWVVWWGEDGDDGTCVCTWVCVRPRTCGRVAHTLTHRDCLASLPPH